MFLCLKGCHPPEMEGCWHEGRLIKLLTFCLLGRKLISLFVCVSFVSFYKMTESVVQHMRNCVCKTQTATTGTRPPLVASHYEQIVIASRTVILILTEIFCTYMYIDWNSNTS